VVSLRNVVLGHALALTLAALALLACGPSDDGAIHSSRVEVMAPCVATSKPVAPTYDDRPQCWVSMRELKTRTLRYYPFRVDPSECPFSCGRQGVYFWETFDAKPDRPLGVFWEAP
jgi:hypothetical protein